MKIFFTLLVFTNLSLVCYGQPETTLDAPIGKSPVRIMKDKCAAKFENITNIWGSDSGCIGACGGYLWNNSTSQNISYREERPDGTICGDNKICHSGSCLNAFDLEFCQTKADGDYIKQAVSFPCKINCVGTGNSMNFMSFNRPNGTQCNFPPLVAGVVTGKNVTGLCTKGVCKVPKNNTDS